MLKKILFFISLLLLINCEKNNKKLRALKRSSETKKGDIVIIFDNAPENWKLEKSDGSFLHNGKYLIEYTKGGILTSHWSPDPLKKKDTLIINNVEKNLEISHKYKGLDEFNYILKPMDTVVFIYDKLLPIINILNRPTKKYDGNFDVLKRKIIVKEDFPNTIKYNLPSMFFIDDIQNFDIESEPQLKIEQRKKAKKELINEKALLDSLYSISLISEDVYDFYILRNYFNEKKLELLNKINTSTNPQLDLKNDQLVYFSFYRDYLKSVIDKKFVSNLSLMKFSNALIPDYRIVYDSITRSSWFSNKEKEYLSFLYLENIIKNFSNSDTDTYFKRFKNSYPKSSSLNFISVNYNLKGGMSQNLNLKTKSNDKLNFHEVIEKNKGKILYVDFWASWCAPCRRAMSASKQLREDYKNTDIVFIYIALNDKTKEWKKASLEEGLDLYKHNYIVENSNSSKFVDDLKLYSIQRYLLYNYNGKLIQTNDPGPDVQEISKIFNQTIK